jgi:hypothetical protein
MEGDNNVGLNGSKLRRQARWDNSVNPAMTALYRERFLNDGLARDVLFVVTGGEREGPRTARVHPGS